MHHPTSGALVSQQSTLSFSRQQLASLVADWGTAALRLLPAETAHEVGMWLLERGLLDSLPSPYVEPLTAGLPLTVAATTVDSQCGSSQQATNLATALVKSGAVDAALACGIESMSQIPLGAAMSGDLGRPTPRSYFERYEVTSQFDGAERIAAKWGITRNDTDAFGLESMQRAQQAWSELRFERELVAAGGRGESNLEPGLRIARLRCSLGSGQAVFPGELPGAEPGTDGSHGAAVARQCPAPQGKLRPAVDPKRRGGEIVDEISRRHPGGSDGAGRDQAAEKSEGSSACGAFPRALGLLQHPDEPLEVGLRGLELGAERVLVEVQLVDVGAALADRGAELPQFCLQREVVVHALEPETPLADRDLGQRLAQLLQFVFQRHGQRAAGIGAGCQLRGGTAREKSFSSSVRLIGRAHV